MGTYSIIGIILATVMITMIIMVILIPYLQKRGINIGGIITTTADTIDIVTEVFKQVKKLFEGTEALDIINRILEFASDGVKAAEQLYLSSQISADERKKTAKEFTYTALKLAGYRINEDIEKLIDGAIEAAVNALPKTHTHNLEKENVLMDSI